MSQSLKEREAERTARQHVPQPGDQGQLAVGGAKAVRPRRCDSSALNLYSLFTMSTNGENTF